MDPRTLIPPTGKVFVLAPHPDDEILGVGGLLARLSRLGAQLEVIAVTDGEASHPDRAEELRARRQAERKAALSRLGLDAVPVHRLQLPDGSVRADMVSAAARPLVRGHDVLLAPWGRDGHPDHDACGQAAAKLTEHVWSYLVWAWHWATPAEIPWTGARRIPLDRSVSAAKRFAVHAFASQLTGPDPILPRHALDRLLRSDEVLLAARA